MPNACQAVAGTRAALALADTDEARRMTAIAAAMRAMTALM
jgi:hypothetical protein